MKKCDARAGMRIQLHPEMDLAKRLHGAVFGSVMGVSGDVATVKLDALHEPQNIALNNLLDVDGVQG